MAISFRRNRRAAYRALQPLEGWITPADVVAAAEWAVTAGQGDMGAEYDLRVVTASRRTVRVEVY